MRSAIGAATQHPYSALLAAGGGLEHASGLTTYNELAEVWKGIQDRGEIRSNGIFLLGLVILSKSINERYMANVSMVW